MKVPNRVGEMVIETAFVVFLIAAAFGPYWLWRSLPHPPQSSAPVDQGAKAQGKQP